jgi:leucyl-tRNA synthetase
MTYPFAQIENSWRQFWEENRTFRVPQMSEAGFDASKPKYYVLDMFPYPSGVGLHVGHPLGYIASDIVARFKRMQGYNVLHPMGFDAFGLPAEQFAIETGTHPEVTTKNNIENMRKQLKACALSYDWNREISTIDTDYYKWTQWIFLKLFNAWFDEKDQKAKPIQTLISEYEKDRFRVSNKGARISSDSEEFASGKSWNSLSKVDQEKALLGDRLAYMKEVTVNWCPGLGTVLANEEVTNEGRSERGNFPVFKRPLNQWILRITSYADRLIQDLSLVDWPDAIKQMQTHWIGKSEGGSVLFALEKDSSQKIEVFTTRPDTLMGATFLALAPQHPLVAKITTPENKKSVEAIAHTTPDDEKKSGAFTGAYALHPVTGKQIPIWVASYILMDYGTGAIMAVPGHDQRDHEFAKQYNLPVLQVVESSEKTPENQAFEGEGTAINSDFLNGLKTSEAKKKMISFLQEKNVGSSQVQYKLRDWLFSRQRYWGEPFPILHHPDGYPVAIPENELPIMLPPLKDFKPSASDDPNAQPQPSLGRAEENWKTVEKDGVTYQRELNTMPNWAGSCWYYLRFIDPDNAKALVDSSEEKYWMGKNGVDLYIGGVEHAVLHLLYARFWHKVLFDLGFVTTNEPFGKLFNQGYIQAYSYQDERGMYVDATKIKETSPGKFEYEGKPVTRNLGKMGKSLKNSISPDEVIETYGCDTFRLYEMYLGPLEQSKTWDTEAIVGVNRFLQRAWRNLVSENGEELLIDSKNAEGDLRNVLHQTIADVTKMMGDMRFNAAIAKLIELNNQLVALEKIPSDVAKAFVLMLAPFAPHISEEIWKRMGHVTSIAYAPYPKFDEAALKKSTIEIVIQVNGKKRGNVFVPPESTKEQVEEAARSEESVSKHLEGHQVVKVIYVPGRLFSFVVKPL